jgi:ubiquitin-conjugating enzyme E2 variant
VLAILEHVWRVVACVAVVDFLSGFFHWLEDAYGHPDWPMTGAWITRPNILHHHYPSYFTRHSWFKSAEVLLAMAGLTLVGSYCLGCLNWMTGLVVLLGVNANQFHKWAHRSKAENGRLITLLQATGLLQSPAHHARHHRNQKNTHYCVVTNYLNPILDAVGLWDFLERVVFHVLGAKRRVDHSLETVS